MEFVSLIISFVALICAVVALCKKVKTTMTGKEIVKELSKLDKVELKNTSVHAREFFQ